MQKMLSAGVEDKVVIVFFVDLTRNVVYKLAERAYTYIKNSNFVVANRTN